MTFLQTADPTCAGSVKGVSINGKAGKAWAWVTDLGPSAIFKISNLQWNATTAVGSEVGCGDTSVHSKG